MQKQPILLLYVTFDVATDLFENLRKVFEKIIHRQIMSREAMIFAEI